MRAAVVMRRRELVDSAMRLRGDLPVLFMSGYAGGVLGTDALAGSSIELLEKPFTQQSLLTAVARTLARALPPVEGAA